MAKTKTIRVTEETWKDLKKMCNTLEQKANNNTEVTTSASIDLLLSEYNWHHSEEYKKQQETTLRNQFIPKYQHETIIEEMKIEYENEKQKLQQVQPQINTEDLNLQIKKQTEINEELQKTITDKDVELSEFKTSNTVLAQQVNNLTQQMHDKEKEYQNFASETRDFISRRYIEKEYIRYLYHISCFLFRHKKRGFSLAQLDKIFWRTPINQISECLSIIPYPIVPIIRDDSSDGTLIFQFNSRYLCDKSYKEML